MSEPVQAILGDSREVLRTFADNTFDSCCTDPPYALTEVKTHGQSFASQLNGGRTAAQKVARRGFMGQKWDTGETAFDPAFWAEVLRVLKPGAHLFAFSGTRTYHRMVCAIEDAGFEVRDQFAWAFGSGFPKSHSISKAIDRAAGVEREVIGTDKNYGKSRLEDGKTTFGDYAGEWNITTPATDAAKQWEGWGTAAKPAWEPICLARKPLSEGTVAANVLRWGTGALNIDGCRVGTADDLNGGRYSDNKLGDDGNTYGSGINLRSKEDYRQPLGRWPANLIHDGSDEVLAGFPETVGAGNTFASPAEVGVFGVGGTTLRNTHNDHGGSAARFFYCAKADKNDRISRFIEEVKVEWISASGPCQAKLQVDTEQSLEKATVVSPSGADSGWSTFLSGNTLTALFQKAYSCTISTETNSTTDLRTWSLLTRSLTSGFTGDVRYETANGGSPAESAASGPQSITITLARTASLPGASTALSRTPLKISVSGRQHGHPTTKPVDLMAYLVRLVTRKGGTCLDPFAGSGTTGEAAMREGCKAVLIEREPTYHADIERRMKLALAGPEERQRAIIKASGNLNADPGPLFSETT
jgi:DNA modification methylase